MSQFNVGRNRAFKATASLVGKQFYIVALDTSNANQVVLANAQTLPIIGIVANAPVAGDVADVHMINGQGTMKVVLGGTVSTIGQNLTADSSGTAIVTTTDKDIVIGKALQTGVAGEVIEIMFGSSTLSVA